MPTKKTSCFTLLPGWRLSIFRKKEFWGAMDEMSFDVRKSVVAARKKGGGILKTGINKIFRPQLGHHLLILRAIVLPAPFPPGALLTVDRSQRPISPLDKPISLTKLDFNSKWDR